MTSRFVMQQSVLIHDGKKVKEYNSQFQEEKPGRMPPNLYMDMRFLSHNTIVFMH